MQDQDQSQSFDETEETTQVIEKPFHEQTFPGSQLKLENVQRAAEILAPLVVDYANALLGLLVDFGTRVLELRIENVERKHVENVVEMCCGNITLASKLLGIDRRTLYRKMERYKNADQPTTQEKEEESRRVD